MTVFGQVPPHAEVPALLPEAQVDALLDWAVARRVEFKPSPVKAGIVPDFRNSLSLRAFRDSEWAAMVEARARAALPDMLAQLGMVDFEVNKVEMTLVAYPDGCFYRRHIDTRSGPDRTATDRILTMVYYFHRLPCRFTGGALRLQSILPSSAFLDIAPQRNLLVAFPSFAPHEVLPVHCESSDFADSRFGVNIWFRRNRPAGDQ